MAPSCVLVYGNYQDGFLKKEEKKRERAQIMLNINTKSVYYTENVHYVHMNSLCLYGIFTYCFGQ